MRHINEVFFKKKHNIAFALKRQQNISARLADPIMDEYSSQKRNERSMLLHLASAYREKCSKEKT